MDLSLQLPSIVSDLNISSCTWGRNSHQNLTPVRMTHHIIYVSRLISKLITNKIESIYYLRGPLYNLLVAISKILKKGAVKNILENRNRHCEFKLFIERIE